jgi:hypothetical protein
VKSRQVYVIIESSGGTGHHSWRMSLAGAQRLLADLHASLFSEVVDGKTEYAVAMSRVADSEIAEATLFENGWVVLDDQPISYIRSLVASRLVSLDFSEVPA